MADTHSLPDGDLNESRDLQTMHIDSGIGSGIGTDDDQDARLHAIDRIAHELRTESGTLVNKASSGGEEKPTKAPEGFAAVFSIAEQKEIREQLNKNSPHRAVWTDLMKTSKRRSKAQSRKQSKKKSVKKSEKEIKKSKNQSKNKSRKQSEGQDEESSEEEEYWPITHGLGRQFTEAEIRDLNNLTNTAPVHQFRAYSLGGVGRSGGFTSPSVILSNSCRNGIKLHRKLTDMTTLDAGSMFLAHLCWMGRREDEHLSFTSSLELCIGIAYQRHERGQEHVYIAWGNTRKLQTPAGERAAFYPVLGLRRRLPDGHILGLTKRTRDKLQDRYFTQETVSFGEMLDPDRAVVHVPFETLVENGLLELIPELIIDNPLLEHNGMYNHYVWMKRKLFRRPKAKDITQTELVLCDRIASCFRSKSEAKAPFWCFIKFLSVRLRPDKNSAFRAWVREHYNESDIVEGIYDEMGTVSDNLLDVKQALLLAREAATSLELRPNPVPVIRPINSIYMDEHAQAEVRLWPPQCKDLDCISEELVKENIYGNSDECYQARRVKAHCDDTLAEMLQLARLFTRPDRSTKYDGVQKLDDAPSDASPNDRVELIPTKSLSLAEQIMAIKEEKKKKEAKRKEEAERKEKPKIRQNRKLLREKHNLLSSSEKKRKRKKEVKHDGQEKIEYRFFPGSLETGQAEDDPEVPTEKEPRAEKSLDEQRAECMGKFETLSGRLRRRKASRKKIAQRNERWKKNRFETGWHG